MKLECNINQLPAIIPLQLFFGFLNFFRFTAPDLLKNPRLQLFLSN